jgi:proteasome-associated ATPase
VSEVTSQTDQTRALHAKIDELADNNQKLAATLRDAREQIIGLKNEVDKLSAPPNGYATYLGQAGNGLVNVMVNGRKMRVEIAPSLNLDSLKPGQEVILNESMNVVVAGQYESHGEMATFHELLPDGERAIVIGRSEEERIVHLAEPLRSAVLKQGDSLLYDTRSGFAFELVNKTEVEELILEEVPDINYTDIGGLGPQIEQIRDAVELPFLHRDLYKTYELKAPKGILLYGPPGCGKTLIAKAVANSLAKKVTEISGIGEGRSYFLNVKGPELLNKYVGETERQIRLIFQKAREKANEGTPVIVFFDEMDSLFRTRGTGVSSDVENTIVPQLLAEIDGVESLENVIVIGASNREDMIDPAILRPGRLDVKIKIERPTATAAREIFRIYLTPDLPIHDSALSKFGDGAKAASQMTDDLVDEMFSTVPANEFLEVTYANGEKEILYFKDFSSGAMIENIVARAKKDAIKNFLATGESGIKYEHLQQAARAEFRENEDLPNTTNPDDWARISGKKGERIVFMRTLIQDEQGGESGRTIDTTSVVNHYL